MRVDPDGGIYYADSFGGTAPADPGEPAAGIASYEGDVPVSPFPAELIFHSAPASSFRIYLDFDGEIVSDSPWNFFDELERTTIPAVPYSHDSDRTTFSSHERRYIKEAWQRVAEDFAPFNVDVTTEPPGPPDSHTVHVLVTSSYDANGQLNPSGTGGGVAYLNSWGQPNNYVWCYVFYSAISECASHEVGHTLSLTHDGLVAAGPSPAVEYYTGHGSGDTSWAPLMGTSYGRDVTQWSNGGYYRASNSQDDRDQIDQRFGYRVDDHGNTSASATPLAITAGTIQSTTPEDDPGNLYPANKGVMQGDGGAADVFSFAWNGQIDLSVKPWTVPMSSVRGGNLDIRAELFDINGTLIGTSNPPDETDALISTTVPAGTYYLYVYNSETGNPFAMNPDGYTSYGSEGQFFISATGAGTAIDADSDGVWDADDNCINVANTNQCDSDADGYGNRCDGDLNNNIVTNSQDYILLQTQLGQPSIAPVYNQADLNCTGTVNSQDYILFRKLLGLPPGPSGLAP